MTKVEFLEMYTLEDIQEFGRELEACKPIQEKEVSFPCSIDQFEDPVDLADCIARVFELNVTEAEEEDGVLSNEFLNFYENVRDLSETFMNNLADEDIREREGLSPDAPIPEKKKPTKTTPTGKKFEKKNTMAKKLDDLFYKGVFFKDAVKCLIDDFGRDQSKAETNVSAHISHYKRFKSPDVKLTIIFGNTKEEDFITMENINEE